MSHIIFLKKENAITFILNRFIRIAPTYWFYTLVMVLLIIKFGETQLYSNYSIKTLIKSLFFISSANPISGRCFPTLTVGWTLNYEMFFYIILFFSILINKKTQYTYRH